MNKSVTSYILGHAMCDGYIGGLDDRINDWPLISSSLYENQKIIDFLNMSVGDQKYINEYKGDKKHKNEWTLWRIIKNLCSEQCSYRSKASKIMEDLLVV